MLAIHVQMIFVTVRFIYIAKSQMLCTCRHSCIFFSVLKSACTYIHEVQIKWSIELL